MEKRTRTAPTVEQIDAALLQSPNCIWPGCQKPKYERSHVCRVHTALVVQHHARMTQDPAEVKAKQKATASTRGNVYVIKVEDLIKIGFSTRIYDRLRTYPPNAELLAVFPGTKALEKELHGRFRFALRKGREWFRDAPEIRELVTEKVNTYGPPDPWLTDRMRDANRTRQYTGSRSSAWTRAVA